MTLAGLTTVHSVLIQQATVSKGGSAARKMAWLVKSGAPTEARAVPASAREIADFERKGQQVDTKFYFSTDPGMDETCRIVFGGQYYEYAATLNPDHLGWYWIVFTALKTSSPENA